jgi:hypothetical protein
VVKRTFRKNELVRDVRPEVDALVSFVPDGSAPSSELQNQIDLRGYCRWYPIEGGHLVKVPFQGAEPPDGPFRIESKGWDHDHCDACESDVHAGDIVWCTTDANFGMICNACYDRLSTRWRWPWSRT